MVRNLCNKQCMLMIIIGSAYYTGQYHKAGMLKACTALCPEREELWGKYCSYIIFFPTTLAALFVCYKVKFLTFKIFQLMSNKSPLIFLYWYGFPTFPSIFGDISNHYIYNMMYNTLCCWLFFVIGATCDCLLSMSDPVSLLTSCYVFRLFCRPRNGNALEEPVWGGIITNLCEEDTSQTYVRRTHHNV